MEYMRVVCGIIKKDDKILITQRLPTGALPNKWEFPGGKPKRLETDISALVREIDEELGISIQVERLFMSNKHHYTDTGVAIELVAYEARWLGGEVRHKEVQDHRWISPEELDHYDLAEADIPIYEEYKKRQTIL